MLDSSNECPAGMVYQQCGPMCPQTCQNIESPDCYSGCAEGCFCPDGLVLLDGRCVDSVVCPSMFICAFM